MVTKLSASFVCLFILATLVACSSPATVPTKPVNRYGATPEQVVKIAESMLGVKYHYGGKTPGTGFDCSGLVYFSYLQVGITLPRTSSAQYAASKPVSKKSIRRGDLLFFRIYRGKISHVGIYLGNNRFVHAPSSGKKVSIGELDSPYWRKRFVRGGRFI
ncbi:hypothetical protein MNBD_GAMMA21-394 [hydrothermal vent metagenome]|uniref:NlpC/P60 domain-containing protein n=1 Tax=hydrothermal vent metagenome TaxID=652676 RepID=A0A3B1AXI9_9ZZZZ